MGTWLPKFQELICDTFTPFHKDNIQTPCTLNIYTNTRATAEVGTTLFRAIVIGAEGNGISVSCRWLTEEMGPCGIPVGTAPYHTTTDILAMRSVELIAGGKVYYAKQIASNDNPIAITHTAIPSLRAQVNQDNILLTMPEIHNGISHDDNHIGHFSATTSGATGERAPFFASEGSPSIIRTGPIYALIYFTAEELKFSTTDLDNPVIGDLTDLTRSVVPNGYIDIVLDAPVTLATPTSYPKPTFGYDYINFVPTITTSSLTGYSPISSPTAGIQIVDVGGNKTGLSSTGLLLPIGSPVPIETTYTATITIDGSIVSNISVVGTNAQTYTELLFEINADLTGAVATLDNGNILITSDTVGLSSTVLIADTDLFSSLTGYVAISPPVDGDIPQELNIKYSIDFLAGSPAELISGFPTVNRNIDFFGYEAQTIGDLMGIINTTGVVVSIENNAIKVESQSAGTGSQVLIDADSTAFWQLGDAILGSPSPAIWDDYLLLNYIDIGCGLLPDRHSCDGHTYSLTINLDNPISSSTLILLTPNLISTYEDLIIKINEELGCTIVELFNSTKIRITSPSIGVTSTADIDDTIVWDMFEELQYATPVSVPTINRPSTKGKDPTTDGGFASADAPYVKTYTGDSPSDGWIIFDSSIPLPTLYEPEYDVDGNVISPPHSQCPD